MTSKKAVPANNDAAKRKEKPATPKKPKTRIAQAGPKQSRSNRAGIIFPVGRVNTILRKGKFSNRVAASAPIFFAAVLQYIVAEVLEVSVDRSRNEKKLRISPRHIMLGVRGDVELSKFAKDATIMYAGVPIHIEDALLAPPKGRRQPADGERAAAGQKKKTKKGVMVFKHGVQKFRMSTGAHHKKPKSIDAGKQKSQTKDAQKNDPYPELSPTPAKKTRHHA